MKKSSSLIAQAKLNEPKVPHFSLANIEVPSLLISAPKKYFLSIGRLTKQKNYILLLKLIKNLKHEEINEKKFVIIGEGEEKLSLLRYIKENNLEKSVKLIGYKKNVFKWGKWNHCKF